MSMYTHSSVCLLVSLSLSEYIGDRFSLPSLVETVHTGPVWIPHTLLLPSCLSTDTALGLRTYLLSCCHSHMCSLTKESAR